jgi:hypothetical protein
LIGIETVARELFLKLGVTGLRRTANAHAEGLAFKALEELLKLRFARLRQHQAALGGFAVTNFVKLAKFANAVEMAEEVKDEEFIRSESGKNGGPNKRCVFAADGLAALGFEQLKADSFDVGAKVEGFDIEGEWRQRQGAGIERRLTGGAHTSDSFWGNLA